MRRLIMSLVAAAAGLLVMPGLASARPAVTTDSTSLRAGPALDFPVVDRIPGDVTVNVHGCVRGYRWCDVSWRDARGWLPATELAYLYNGRRVTIVEYGPRIGLPIIAFSVDRYWDRYYRGRPFYGERTRWRTVWRDRDGGRSFDRDRDRREGRTERRDSKIDRRADRRDVDRNDGRDTRRAMDRDRRTDRDRANTRTGRSELRQGESRGFGPQTDRGARQGQDRGDTRGNAPSMRERSGSPGMGGAPSMGGRGDGGGGGRDGGGRGEGRPN